MLGCDDGRVATGPKSKQAGSPPGGEKDEPTAGPTAEPRAELAAQRGGPVAGAGPSGPAGRRQGQRGAQDRLENLEAKAASLRAERDRLLEQAAKHHGDIQEAERRQHKVARRSRSA